MAAGCEVLLAFLSADPLQPHQSGRTYSGLGCCPVGRWDLGLVWAPEFFSLFIIYISGTSPAQSPCPSSWKPHQTSVPSPFDMQDLWTLASWSHRLLNPLWSPIEMQKHLTDASERNERSLEVKFKCHSKRSEYLWVLSTDWWRKTFFIIKKSLV